MMTSYREDLEIQNISGREGRGSPPPLQWPLCPSHRHSVSDAPFGTENMSLDRYRIVKCFSNSLLTALILVNAVAVAQLWQAVARVLIGARRQGLQESVSNTFSPH